jgi:hypothetical protein
MCAAKFLKPRSQKGNKTQPTWQGSCKILGAVQEGQQKGRADEALSFYVIVVPGEKQCGRDLGPPAGCIGAMILGSTQAWLY